MHVQCEPPLRMERPGACARPLSLYEVALAKSRLEWISPMDAVIVTHNVRDYAVRCVRALLASTVAPSRLVLVDTGTDATARVIEGLGEAAVVQSLSLPENPGYGQAANAGVARTDSPFVVIANADVFPAPDTLEVLETYLIANPLVACAGAYLTNRDGSEQEAAFRFPGIAQLVLDLLPAPTLLRRSQWNGRVPTRQTPTDIDFPLGAFLAVRRATFDAVGGFDPAFYMYAEEVDLCARFREAGWRVVQVPSARVAHAGGASTRQVPDEMLAELFLSRARWYARHASTSKRAIALSVMVTGLGARALAPGPRRRAYRKALAAIAHA